jgi:hypothetical protein
VGPFVAILIHAFIPATEPTPPPPRHSPMPNICYAVVYDPETGGTKVDRSVDKCANARKERRQ